MNEKLSLYKDHLLNKFDSLREFEITIFDFVKALTDNNTDESLKQRLYKIKALAKIKSISEDENYFIISYNELKSPLYYPKSENIYSVYLNAMEAFYKKNGHYYQINATKVQKDDIVVDCGAAEGLFSLIASEVCKKVYAVEPLPKFIDSMKVTFKEFSNVEIIPAALSNGIGTANLSIDGAASSLDNSGNGIAVPLDTIDNLFYKKNIPITYIKADVEGYELEMLEGAQQTIKAFKPKLAITTYHKLHHAELISKFVKSINPDYKILIKGSSYLKSENKYLPMLLHAWL